MDLQKILSEYYNLRSCIITTQKGGWTSLAFKVESEDDVYFLKVYEKVRKSTSKWTALIDNYIPIVIWLNDNFLKGKIIEPLLTIDKKYKYENENIICILFKYIEGETIGENALNGRQVEELAYIISELHSHGGDVPFPKDAITENYDMPFNTNLLSFIKLDTNVKLEVEIKDIVLPYIQKIKTLIKHSEEAKDRLIRKNVPFVLCHTDIHNWNLMQTHQSLVLIDWEGLKYAPAESDLYTLTKEPYFKEFMSVYNRKHENFIPDNDALLFYQYRRKLEDIWEFVELLLTPELDISLKYENIKGLRNELLALSKLV